MSTKALEAARLAMIAEHKRLPETTERTYLEHSTAVVKAAIDAWQAAVLGDESVMAVIAERDDLKLMNSLLETRAKAPFWDRLFSCFPDWKRLAMKWADLAGERTRELIAEESRADRLHGALVWALQTLALDPAYRQDTDEFHSLAGVVDEDLTKAWRKAKDAAADSQSPTETFEFTILASGLDPAAHDFELRFHAAGCDDATIAYQGGRIVLDFTREAASLDLAIGSALKNVMLAGAVVCGIRVTEQTSESAAQVREDL